MKEEKIMKKTALSVIFSLIVTVCLLLSSTAYAAYVLDFYNGNDDPDSAYTEADGVFTVDASTHPKAQVNFEKGVEFEVKYDFTHDWVNITLVNEANYENCYLGNMRVTLLLWGTNNSFELRVIPEGYGWDNPLVNLGTTVESVEIFSDDQWHKISVSKASGSWSIMIDGVETCNGISSDVSAALDTLLGGEVAYVGFGTNSGTGTYQVRSAEIADVTEAPVTEAPVTEAPATEAPATQPEDDNPGTSDAVAVASICALILAAGGAAVVIKRRK